MSVYSNPIYGNSTISYSKLNESEKPKLLSGLITTDNYTTNDYIRRRQRIKSAITCLLCSLAIILTCLAAVLALYGVFGRCFQSEDLDTDDFEKFLEMMQPKRDSKSEPPKYASLFSKGVIPFSQKVRMIPPGPSGSSPFEDHRVYHAMCPLMDTINCRRISFDGYSLQEHQQRVDLHVGKMMLDGVLNTSYAVNTARRAFKHCVTDFDSDKAPLTRHFANRLMEVKNYKHRTEDSASLLAELAILGRLDYGVDSLFEVEISANYLAPDGERPYMMYLSQRLPTAPTAALMTMLRRAFQNKLNETDYQKIHLNVPRILAMAADPEDSMSWKSFTAAEAYARWPWMNFQVYLSQLNSMERFAHNVKEFIFVVKTPTYFDKLNAMFVPKSSNEENEKVELFKLLTIYNIFAENDKLLGIEKEEDDIRRNNKLGDTLQLLSPPYRLLYTHDDGQASYNAIRFCSKELRTNLPHIASAVFSADTSADQSIQQAMLRVEELIEMARSELILWVNEAAVNQSLKNVLTEKLRKIGVSFVTRGSLEKDSFEEAHRKLNWENVEVQNYLDMIPIIKNFLLKRKLERLNTKIEALRSSIFSEASAPTVRVEYSRLGNWLKVPSSLLTSPILAASPTPLKRTVVYSNLLWIISRELSKSIDSEGILYNSIGVHKRGEADIKSLEQLWTGSQTCLEQNLHSSQLNGISKGIVVRQSTNEMIGFQIAYRSFEKEVESIFSDSKIPRTKEELRTTSVKNFFQTSTAVYCRVPENGASVPLLDRFVDFYVKKHEILGCSSKYLTSDCEIKPQ